MSPRILVPLDGSALAEQALPSAVAAARAMGGTVHLCRVSVPAVGEHESRLLREADLSRGYVRGLRRMLRVEMGVPVRTGLRSGHAAESVLREADLVGADLIVLTKKGAGADRTGFIGSTADEIVHRAQCPVLILPPRSGRVDWGDGAFRRILLPMHGQIDADDLLAGTAPLESPAGVTYAILPLRPPAHAESQGEPGHQSFGAVPPQHANPGGPILQPRATSAFGVLRAARDIDAELIAFGLPLKPSRNREPFGPLLEPLLRVASIPVLLQRSQKGGAKDVTPHRRRSLG